MTASRRITFLTSMAAGVTWCASRRSVWQRRRGRVVVARQHVERAGGHGRRCESRLGKILVDSRGRALYLFKADVGTKSACAGACVVAWPPLRTARRPTVGSGANSSLVSTTAGSDGEPEVTYNGHPVYRFAGDKAPGDVNGEGLTAFGDEWLALSPAGDEVTNQRSSSGSSGGGY